ncbi:MAG: CarD family transcriptional regulator [Ruminococcaceae bacterium]|nr:CarD family transcriptional regulator [Oscillospiraceae bacterium]
MLNKGDSVIYGCHGVCTVIDITKKDFGLKLGEKVYYALKPLYQHDSVYYVPIESTHSVIRPIIDRDEVEKLILKIPSIESAWIANEKEREKQYKALLKTCEPVELIRIIKTLFERKRARISDGKKATSVDDRYFKLAEEQLYGELAISLQIDKSEVKEYITQKLAEVNI